MKLRDQAYGAFTRHLLERRLLPGQFVSQRELAAATSMSLASIREMIPRLEAEGLIKAISQRGLQIARIDLPMVQDAFQLREMVELMAVAAFARHASDAEIAAHRDRLDAIKAAAARDIGDTLLRDAQEADWALHDAFVARLDNRIIAELHRVNSIRIRMILGERIGLSARRLPIAIREHEAILDALARRDEAGSVAALAAHLSSSRRRALNFEALDDPPVLDGPGTASP
ncbi:MAG TPA: GntR family transcriptional regulator [Stellaceae bacterium]|nr:GntR family transcriptional regulator [Stellaceae bacterium]